MEENLYRARRVSLFKTKSTARTENCECEGGLEEKKNLVCERVVFVDVRRARRAVCRFRVMRLPAKCAQHLDKTHFLSLSVLFESIPCFREHIPLVIAQASKRVKEVKVVVTKSVLAGEQASRPRRTFRRVLLRQ